MKKLLLILAFAGLVSACSSDDSGSNSGLKPASITLQSNGNTPVTRNFTYDGKGRLATVSSENFFVTLTYLNNNKIDKLISDTGNLSFVYDGNNLVALQGDNGSLPVTSQSQGVLVFSNQTFVRNGAGDWSSISNLTFAYTSGKGVFANVKSLDLFALYLIDNQSLVYASKKRVESIASGGETFPYVAGALQKGLPITATLAGTTITATYSE
ncbi:hypothetical protein [Flavobacterium sp.]|uniref:hypothetical protein n=1 Tax=Flavobacterium sp. TaxID=239 RepID=UPI0011F59BF0|nr:hypothetical protein [Flavobacterium sp.]RZJ72875.1 MAG: hypothetical protein EOO49_04375 [Flavobacterium sp.]